MRVSCLIHRTPYFFLFLIFLVLGCKRNRVINQPDFDTSNRESLGIDRIELTDTATILDVSLYNVPGFWVNVTSGIKLIGTTTGKEYALKSMIDMAPDVLIHVDSMGFFSGRILFEPIDEEDKEIDLTDSDGTNIQGIKLYDVSENKIRTHLTGTLEGMGNSWLIAKEIKNLDYGKTYVIPVRDGKFDYDIYTDYPYVFVVYGGKESREWIEGSSSELPIFWSEGGNIRLNFHDDSSKGFSIEGGPLTKEMTEYYKKEDDFQDNINKSIPELERYYRLKDQKLLYIPEYYTLLDSFKNSTLGNERIRLRNEFYALYQMNGEDEYLPPYSEEGKKAATAFQKYMALHEDSIEKLHDAFIAKELIQPSMTHLFEIYGNVNAFKDIDRNLNWFKTYYADTFTYHPYHKYLMEMLSISSQK